MNLSVAILFLLIFFQGLVFSQTNSGITTRQKVHILATQVSKQHFSPKPINDSLSADIFNQLLKELDPNKVYFTKPVLKELEKYRYSLDEELIGKSWGFTEVLAGQYKKSVGLLLTFTQAWMKQPDLTNRKGFFTYSENSSFPADEAAQKTRWGQFLTWQVHTRMYDNWVLMLEEDSANAQRQPPAANSNWYKEQDSVASVQIGKRVIKRLQKWEQKPTELIQYIDQLYLNAIASVFDPHTQYFDSKTAEAFDDALSSQTLSYGFDWEEDDEGSFSISGLQPGSAAWHTGNIYVDDKLEQIKTADGKVKKVKDLSASELEDLLSKQGKEQIELTLKSADGKQKTVKLKKEETENEENTVRGYVLEGAKKIGYLSLPSFYTSWGNAEGSGCANDISKEIIKLKREKIEGLIFDLRYNGGGSLQEAIEIAGIFIDAGPMCLIRETEGKLITLKDPTRGTIYDGPMVVLINGQSASASELVAGTLQDYNRALIAGSPSFGKATMQVVLPLDSNFRMEQLKNQKTANQKTSEDQVKITLGKLYRINGKTNQLQGVIPDLLLPDPMEALGYTERKLPFALPSDSVTTQVAFQKIPKDLSGAKDLQASINAFPEIAEVNQWIKQIEHKQKTGSVPLEWLAFVSWNQEWEPLAEKNNDPINSVSYTYTPVNTSYTERLMALESDYKKSVNLDMIESLKNDIYIEAAFRAIQKFIP